MPSAMHYYPSYDKVPLCFAACGAEVLPGPILVELMTALDLSESANKAILNRMVGLGRLELAKAGRVGLYSLAGRMKRDFQQISDGAADSSWDGRFHTLIYDAPVGQAARLRTAALRNGYRQLRPGVLVSVRDESDEFSAEMRPLVVRSGWLETDLEVARSIAYDAWDLAALAQEGESIVTQLEAMASVERPASGQAAFRLLHQAVRPAVAWFVKRSGLPRELMPDDWPGARLGAAMGDIYGRVAAQVGAYSAEVIAASPHRDLVVWTSE